MALDVSDEVYPDNGLLALRAARIIGLDLAGVALISPDISCSWQEVGGAICEVNAQPGFRPHWLAAPERDINGEILVLLFEQTSPRIPTVVITATYSKSTTARMLHHIWLAAGRCAGACTTQGVWIGADQMSSRHLSGLPGAQMILRDPAVEVGIFEIPRMGLIHDGHPCDRYDVLVLLNVQDDHIGQDGVADLEQMARLKAQVLERSCHMAILNAE
jgi:cyanophycin synthetase